MTTTLINQRWFLLAAAICFSISTFAQDDAPAFLDGFGEPPGNGFHYAANDETSIEIGVFMPGSSDSTTTHELYSHNVWVSGDWFYWRMGALDIGLDLSYNKNQYRVTQDSLSALGYGAEHDRQKLVTYGLGGEFKLRVAFDQTHRKNLEFGPYFIWNIGRRLKTFDELDPNLNAGAKNNKTVQRKLDYVSPIDYGAYARLRWNKLFAVARYRASDFFQASDGINGGAKLSEWEGLSIGLGFVIEIP